MIKIQLSLGPCKLTILAAESQTASIFWVLIKGTAVKLLPDIYIIFFKL